MELIVSHNNTDFDGLASMIGASKLYPAAVMVIEGKPTRQVREFLALHKDALPFQDLKTIDWEKVTRVVVVDTCSLSRLGSVGKLIQQGQVEVHLYDHHPTAPKDIFAERELLTTIGATTTLLVEQIQAQHLSLSPFEATLLALGIYEDTGSLLFASTTARDVKAVGFLLEAGANLKVVAQFIERPLSREQKSLLNRLLTSARHYLIKNTRVLITATSIDEFVAGLALLTHKVAEIEDLDVIFAVVKMDDRVHIVGRSKGDSLAVNEILANFGGAGHPKAASATVKNGNVEAIISQLLALLEEKVTPEITAREIMSSPVRSVSATTTMAEAGDILLRYGHTGIPVVDDQRLIGIISRRDIDKALLHRLGHSQVKGYMSRNVISISPDTPLNEIREQMIVHDIGRLPVVEGGQLLGIISRSDVLRTIHGQAVPVNQPLLNQRSAALGEQILQLMENLPLPIRDLFRLIQEIGKEQQLSVYVVGGFVRDLLLGVENLDIDLVVEGDGISFASCLAQLLGVKVQLHPQFGTASLITQDRICVDVVTARMEYYAFPAALPDIEGSNLKQDLYRRDFTINAMAIELDTKHFGVLKDYYGGYRDLQLGQIKILHNLSMVDDPTRILRATRFEQRLGFKLASQTLNLIQRAVEEQLLARVSRERIKNELVLILQETSSPGILKRLKELGVWQQIAPAIELNELDRKFQASKEAVNFLAELGLWGQSSFWQVKLLVLLQDLLPQAGVELVKEFKFERRIVHLTRQFLQAKADLKGIYSLQGELNKGMLHNMLGKAPLEVVAGLLADQQLQAGIKEYLLAWAKAEVLLTGKDLQRLGVPPGPLYAKILSALWEARLEGRINNKQQEQALVRSLIKEAGNV